MSTNADSSVPRLLVIDDEPGICLAVSLLLQGLFEVEMAETAKEARDRLSEPYALILLDLRMPGVKHYELLEYARDHAGETPIAILSATGDPRTCDDVRQRGAVALIEKPFSRKELIARIQQILAPVPTENAAG